VKEKATLIKKINERRLSQLWLFPQQITACQCQVGSSLKKYDLLGLNRVKYQLDLPLIMEWVQQIIQRSVIMTVPKDTSYRVERIEGNTKVVCLHQIEVNGKLLTSKKCSLLLHADGVP
jgi:hypothetical protein